jgi:hypothetical protein
LNARGTRPFTAPLRGQDLSRAVAQQRQCDYDLRAVVDEFEACNVRPPALKPMSGHPPLDPVSSENQPATIGSVDPSGGQDDRGRRVWERLLLRGRSELKQNSDRRLPAPVCIPVVRETGSLVCRVSGNDAASTHPPGALGSVEVVGVRDRVQGAN